MKAVFDSDVLIDYLQGLPEAREELSRYRQPHYSIITGGLADAVSPG